MNVLVNGLKTVGLIGLKLMAIGLGTTIVNGVQEQTRNGSRSLVRQAGEGYNYARSRVPQRLTFIRGGKSK